MILPGFPVMIGGGSSFGQVPVGGILLWESTTPPAGGWELYYKGSMNNRALRGVGPNTPEGVTGGQNRFTVTGTTNTQPNHNGTPFNTRGNPQGSVFPGDGNVWWSATSSAGAHSHTIDIYSNHTPLYRGVPLIRKVEGPGLVPSGASVLMGRPTTLPGYDIVLEYIGRTLRAVNGAPVAGGFPYPTSRSGISTSRNGQHIHGSGSRNGELRTGPGTRLALFSGGHSHSVDVTLDIRLRALNLAQFRAVDLAQPVFPGMVIAYDGSGDLPAGWWHADGANGTVDMRDRYPIISALAQAGQVHGSGNVIWEPTYVSTDGAHSHAGDGGGGITGYSMSHSSVEGAHTHTFPTRGGTVDAAWYGIRFIQYLP